MPTIKNKASHAFHFSVPLYNKLVVVFFKSTDAEIEAYMRKKLGVPKEQVPAILKPFEGGNPDGRAVLFENGVIIVKFYQYPGKPFTMPLLLNLVTHEFIHVASFIFEEVGMPHDVSTDEAYAYLYGYLMEECMKNLLS